MKSFFKHLKYVGVIRRFPYFIAQRVFLINARVPWPVHWSSIVSSHKKIKRAEFRPYPGFMPGQYIQAMNGIEIGKNVRLGPGVKIISSSHDLDDYSKHVEGRPVIIGDNCWIAADAILLPRVELKDHVVVAAGAIVTKSFGPNVLIGGNPAKVIKELSEYSGDIEKW